MRIHLLPIVLLAFCACAIGAQSTTPDDVLTQRLHQNSTLYSKWDHGESMRSKARRTSTDVADTVDESENPVQCSHCAATDPQNDPRIKISASRSDLVAIGSVTRTMSELTPHEAFIFSDAQFIPSTVWYQSSENSKMVGDTTGKEITVTFPGGHVELDGRKLDVHLTTDHLLQLGHSYLLFLKYLPESHSFSLVGVKGFDITGTTVRVLHQEPDLENRLNITDKPEVIEAIRSSVNRAKAEAQK